MRPISLAMEGFTSFRQKTEVDFSKFELFAITGQTGSGKTSIIDAITYALYGCTTRLGKQSISELISQGADRLKVLLVFSSGKQRFRIARATKWTGRSSLTDARLEEWNGEKWISLADKVNDAQSWIERIVGLDFNGFTKSVVLPQGQFDLFLKGKAEERRKILTELLQLDVYQRMMKRANEIAQGHSREADMREKLLANDYATATPEQLTLVKAELEAVLPQIDPFVQRLARMREVLPAALQLRHARGQLAESEAELKKLIPERAAADKTRVAAEERIAKAQTKIAELEASIKKSAYRADLRDQLMAREHKCQRLHQALARRTELEKATSTKSKGLATLESGLKKARAALEVASMKRVQLNQQLIENRKQLDASQKKHGSRDSIKALIQTNKQRIRAEVRKTTLEHELKALNADSRRHEEQMKELAHDIAAGEQGLKKSREGLEALQQAHRAEELKQLLETGKPCPVCEQEVARVPKARKHPSVDQARRAVAACEKQVKLLLDERSAAREGLAQIRPLLKRNQADIEELATGIAAAISAIREVLKKAPGDGAEKELEKLHREALELQRQTALGATQLDEARDNEADAKAAAEDLNRRHSVLRSEVQGVKEEINRVSLEADSLKNELGEFADLSLVKAELKKQNEAREALENLNHIKQVEFEGLTNAKDQFSALLIKLEGMRSRATELTSTTERLRFDADQSCTMLSAFPELKINVAEVDRDAAAQLEQLRAASQTKLDSLKADTHRYEEQVKTIQEKIERASLMRVELTDNRKQAGIAHELAQALRSDQFIAYIQQEAYRRLADTGSMHLNTLSSGRFSIDFDRDEFTVLDQWNADESRPVTTLSGGESFLASLALALALAEGLSGLSHGRGKFALESLFLDEGFGTLDAETLDVVLQGVENLSTTDRLVGIISHIPELADRMPSRIHVRKAVGGSTIEVS